MLVLSTAECRLTFTDWAQNEFIQILTKGSFCFFFSTGALAFPLSTRTRPGGLRPAGELSYSTNYQARLSYDVIDPTVGILFAHFLPPAVVTSDKFASSVSALDQPAWYLSPAASGRHAADRAEVSALTPVDHYHAVTVVGNMTGIYNSFSGLAILMAEKSFSSLQTVSYVSEAPVEKFLYAIYPSSFLIDGQNYSISLDP